MNLLPPLELSTGVEGRPKTVAKNQVTEKIVILQPITMKIPNKYGIYSPSKLSPQKEINYSEFLSKYADRPKKIRVCFDEAPSPDTILQRSEFITAYGYGLDCWYIVASNGSGNGAVGM
jgi:hypothetical protein